MFSQRGVLNLAHNLHDVRDAHRRINANRIAGIAAEWLSTEAVKAFCPVVNTAPDVRYPILGASLQRRAGTARHDAVAWVCARRRCARRRYHPELRGHRHRHRGRAGARRRNDARHNRRRQGRDRRRRPQLAARGDGRRAPADRKSPPAGDGLGTDQTGTRHRHHVERGARLCQPVRQGRTGTRRRHRRLQLLRPAAVSTSSRRRWPHSSSCSRSSVGCA